MNTPNVASCAHSSFGAIDRIDIFRAVRIVLGTGTVIGDQRAYIYAQDNTFSEMCTSSATSWYCDRESVRPFGTPIACNGGGPKAYSNVDMRGTGFSLTPYAFVVGAGTGGITYSNQYTVADLYVGGDCGIITPRNSGEFIPLQETALLLKDVICSVGTYSYGSSTCSNCSLGAAFALNGCLPSSSFFIWTY